jgi:hypothetical protein
LPHDSQKCAARMDPHDQQECVSSGRGFAPIVVRADLVNVSSKSVRKMHGVVRGVLRAQVRLRGRVARAHTGPHKHHAEKDVPQPHDFVA